jgi:3-hydroxybutyryl-CoA dehydrogenase
MSDATIQQITVVGTGMIGADVSLLCAMFRYPVVMLGRTDASLQRGLNRVRTNLDGLIAAGVYSQEEAQQIIGAIRTTTDLAEALRDADFVLEAVIEDLEVKQTLFADLDAQCQPHTILASGTSGLSPNDIGARIERQDKMLVAHFWNPPYLVPLVELVAHDNLSQASLNQVLALLERLGKKPIVLKKDIPGHIGNRLQHALFREAMHLVEQGVATPADIDQVIMSSLGPRYSMIGPMEYMDSVGLDLQVAVQSYLFETLADAKKPQNILMKHYEQGNYGAKTGKGFYDWSVKSLDEMVSRQNFRFIERLKALKKSQS